MITMSAAMMCLALNIYHEARGEPFAGQQAVAHVTMNRAEGNYKNVCDVVAKPKQFSWTGKQFGFVKSYKKGQFVLTAKGKPTDEEAWNQARKIAFDTLRGRNKDFTSGATYYHAKTVKPDWSKSFRLVMTIGQHKFYRGT